MWSEAERALWTDKDMDNIAMMLTLQNGSSFETNRITVEAIKSVKRINKNEVDD